MKFAFPSFNQIIKTVVISFILAVIVFFIAPYLGIQAIESKRLLTYGVLAGSLLGGFLSICQIEVSFGEKQVSIFIGNLAFKASANDLRELFSAYGEVQGVRVMTDRATRRPKGFAFVEMDKKSAKAAIEGLDGSEFFGRDLKVNYATRRKNAA